MKNLLTGSGRIMAAVIALFSVSANAQEIDTISINNMFGMASSNGILFQDITAVNHGYRLGGETGPSAIFSMGFWMGGLDGDGQLHSANQLYFGEEDFYPGPIADDYTSSDYLDNYAQGIWTLFADEINDHIANWSGSGYVVPTAIAEWPANGNASIGVSDELAPYYDYNGNEMYDPENGDYPMIRGDQASYIIFNDENGTHVNGAEVIGVEVHVMIYQYDTIPDLNSTTFMNVKLFNRRDEDYTDFAFSVFTDFDFGDVFNDYVGCDSARNVSYTYNSHVEDPQWGATSGALGLVNLDDQMESSRMMNGSAGLMGWPVNPDEFYNSSLGLLTDGSPFYNDGINGFTTSGYTTKYLHNGNPSLSQWSELVTGNPAGDRRTISGMASQDFPGGEMLCYDFALVYDIDFDSTNVENVSTMLAAVDVVQDWYNDQEFECYSYAGTAGLEQESKEVLVFPNPTSGNFTVQFEGDYNLKLISMNGQLVYEDSNLSGSSNVSADLESGMYILMIEQNDQVYHQRLIIK